jgi:hypothetical protein
VHRVSVVGIARDLKLRAGARYCSMLFEPNVAARDAMESDRVGVRVVVGTALAHPGLEVQRDKRDDLGVVVELVAIIVLGLIGEHLAGVEIFSWEVVDCPPTVAGLSVRKVLVFEAKIYMPVRFHWREGGTWCVGP